MLATLAGGHSLGLLSDFNSVIGSVSETGIRVRCP